MQRWRGCNEMCLNKTEEIERKGKQNEAEIEEKERYILKTLKKDEEKETIRKRYTQREVIIEI